MNQSSMLHIVKAVIHTFTQLTNYSLVSSHKVVHDSANCVCTWIVSGRSYRWIALQCVVSCDPSSWLAEKNSAHIQCTWRDKFLCGQHQYGFGHSEGCRIVYHRYCMYMHHGLHWRLQVIHFAASGKKNSWTYKLKFIYITDTIPSLL